MNIAKIPVLAGYLILFFSLTTACTPSQPIATVLMIDKSASALEDKQFTKIASEGCNSVAKGLLPTDYAGQITVDGSVPRASDLTQVLDPRLLHHDCQKPDAALVNTSIPKGTFSCPAWNLAYDLNRRQSAASLSVLYVSIIQTNEKEVPCPHVWRKLAEDAHKRGGRLVIAGSSVGDEQNPALDNTFNQLLWQQLKDSPSVDFCKETDVRGCIEKAFLDLRTPKGDK
jgi:hypothetical protein